MVPHLRSAFYWSMVWYWLTPFISAGIVLVILRCIRPKTHLFNALTALFALLLALVIGMGLTILLTPFLYI